ncbi:autoinducer-binding protein [Mesorhizobium sp. CGMCC 1.15528]|uniref:Autoinducer-binding protein n=1 Tax=Mesorhizobium zhangyense TaxID=1776730 RepID=A0A7C9VFJ5_9HYPH|nr:autoinducer-binding protein [Mesorhizobium zhangyense]
MKIWFQRLTDIIAVAQDEVTLKKALVGLVQELGFDFYAFMHIQPVRMVVVSNYPAEWQARYVSRDYARIDPIIAAARLKMEAFDWAADDRRPTGSRAVGRFYAEATAFGIRSGISIPVRTAFGHVSILTLASNKKVVCLEEDIDPIAAATAVAHLHARLEHQTIETRAHTQVRLTAKQALCLKWAAEGKTMKAIAMIENMSFANVCFHISNARKALDAETLPQATARATQLGLI